MISLADAVQNLPRSTLADGAWGFGEIGAISAERSGGAANFGYRLTMDMKVPAIGVLVDETLDLRRPKSRLEQVGFARPV
jgi:hypothetical protein